jgi:carbonic anhydrase/acetyltransferase-like protein (isoleucine patch superfamily)
MRVWKRIFSRNTKNLFTSGCSQNLKARGVFSRRLQIEALEQRAMLDITTGLIAHWTFDETSGTMAADSTGNGNTGTLAGNANWEPTAGVSGGAIRLSGNNDGVLVESATGYNLTTTTARTISLWFKADDLNDVGIHPLYEEGSSSSGMVIYIHCGFSGSSIVAPTLTVGAWNSYSSSWSTYLTTTSIVSGQWYNVAVTLTGASGVTSTGLKAYLNGAQFSSGKAGPLYYGNNTSGFMADDTGIGRNYYGITTAQTGYINSIRYYFHGLIDDVRVYSRTLSAADVSSLYSLYSANASNTYDYTSGLISYWKCDETSGTSIADSIGSNTGTLSGSVTLATSSGVSGGALSFTSGSMTVASSSSLNTTSFADRTISLWFNCTNFNATNQIIYEQGSGTTSGFVVYINGGKLYVGGWNKTSEGDGWNGTFLSTISFSQSEWHNVVLVLNGGSSLADGAFSAYLDGYVIDTGEGSFISADSGNVNIGNVSGTTLLASGATTGNVFTGKIDEIREYDRALTPGEIAALYDAYEPTTSVYVPDNCPYGTVGTAFPNSLSSEHFVIYWGSSQPSGWTGPTINAAWAAVELHWMEENFAIIFAAYNGCKLPFAGSNTKYKVNAYIFGTGMADDSTGWAYGGLDDYGTPSLWIAPGAMAEYSTTLIHETTHAMVQGASGGLTNSIYSGWFWENHANYTANDECIGISYGIYESELRPYVRLGSTDDHYLNYYFLVYLAQEYGPDVVNSIWYSTAAASSGQDPMTIMASILKTVDPTKSFADIYGEYCRHNATWLWYNDSDVYRAATGAFYNDTTNRQKAEAIKDEPGWYTVGSDYAPAQYSYNVIQLNPTGNSTTTRSVTVDFDGYNNSALGADYRVSLVIVDANGNERYSDMWSDREMTITLNPGEVYVYLVVAATPTYELCTWGQDYTTQQRYPYKFSVTGAVPDGQTVTVNGVAGSYFANGGGFVASTATVASTAYVASTAAVLGTAKVSGYAKILDYAVVQGSAKVSSYAVVRGHAIVQGSATVTSYAQVAGYATVQGSATVTGYALVSDEALVEDSATISGYACVLGAAQVHDAYVVSGHAVIEQDAYLWGSATVNGDAVLTGTTLINVTTSTGLYLAQQESSPGTADAIAADFNYLYGLYAFNTENSWRVIDSFGSYDGYMNTDTPGWTASSGKYGGVLTFDGTGQFASLPAAQGSRQYMTVAATLCWKGGGGQRIMEFGRDSSNYWYLEVSDSSGTLTFGIVVSGVEYKISASSAITAGSWAQVAFTVGSGTATLYVNGVAVATSTSFSATPDQVMADYGYLGKGKTSGTAFSGSIDEVRFYSTVFTSAQVLALYNSSYGTAQYIAGQTSGTTLTDTTGKNDATITGSATWTNDSVKGYSLKLSQGGQYIPVSSTLANTTDFTFSTWIKWTKTSATQTLFSTGTSTSSELLFSVNSSGYLVLYGVDSESQYGSQTVTSSTAITASYWTHVTFTIQGHTAKIYINGVVVATLYNWDFSPKSFFSTATYIGRPIDGTTTYEYSGYLYDTRICGWAMTDELIAEAATASNNLLASWNLNGDGSDSSGNSNTLTLSGSPTFASGHDGNAITLSGSQYASTASTLLTTTGAFSVSAWVKWDGTSGTNVILSQDGSTSSVFSLQITSAGYFAFYGGTSSYAINTTATTAGAWYHLSGVYTGSLLKLYVNGTLVASTAYSAMTASTGSFIVGAGKSSGSRTNYFYGQIDDVKAYQGILSNNEIYNLYAGGTVPSGWCDAEIGSASKTAGSSSSGTTWTVAGSGSSIGASTKDQLNYAYQLMDGDGTIVARLKSQTGTLTTAKAGVMFRNGDSYDAAFVMAAVTPASGVTLLYRDKNGGTLYSVVVTGVTAPVWVKLVRSGNFFAGYYSTDGATWTRIGTSVKVNMNATACVGMAVCSGSASTLNTATFSNVAVVADTTSPTITGVLARGSTWSSTFLDAIDSQGLGYSSISGLGYLLSGVNQLTTLPWTNIDQIIIVFNKDVDIKASDLAIYGVNLSEYTWTLGYNSITFVATMTLSQAITADKLLLVLNGDTGGVTDASGNLLDGEWTTGTSVFPSGNGTAGGDFQFRINVLPGDVTQDGMVISNDGVMVRNALGTTTGTSGYSVFLDVTGDGMVISNDRIIVRNQLGMQLPDGEPVVPQPTVASGISQAIAAAETSSTPLATEQITPIEKSQSIIDIPETNTVIVTPAAQIQTVLQIVNATTVPPAISEDNNSPTNLTSQIVPLVKEKSNTNPVALLTLPVAQESASTMFAIASPPVDSMVDNLSPNIPVEKTSVLSTVSALTDLNIFSPWTLYPSAVDQALSDLSRSKLETSGPLDQTIQIGRSTSEQYRALEENPPEQLGPHLVQQVLKDIEKEKAKKISDMFSPYYTSHRSESTDSTETLSESLMQVSQELEDGFMNLVNVPLKKGFHSRRESKHIFAN